MTLIPPTFEAHWEGALRAKGRNHFNSSSLLIERWGDGRVTLSNRVDSTGNTDHGWSVLPADPQILRDVANKLLAIASDIEEQADDE